MYIKRSTVKRKGKDGRNRKLVEAYRDPKTGKPRNRTVQTLESLPILERSRLIVKYGGHKHLDPEEWQALVEAGDFSRPEMPTRIGDSFRGAGNWVLLQYFKSTGLESVLRAALGSKTASVVRDMITLQILDPDSKLSYVKKRQASLNYLLEGKRDYHEDTFYGALDKLDEAFVCLREQLNAATPATSKVLLYDLSNSYFCGTQAELGGYGHSKEKRHDRYMVSYGLVTREDGTPLDIRVWKGGTADAQTVHQTFCNWKADYHACQAIWIADRSMSDEGTLEEVREMDLSYITGLPGTAQRAVLSKMQQSQPSLFDQQLTEFTHNERRYILCRHQHKGYREEKANHRNLRKVYDALKHIRKTPQNADKKKLYHRAMKVLEKYRQTHCWRLSFEQYQDQKGKTRYRLVYQFDRRAFKAHNAIAHYYVLQTDLSSQALSPVEAQQFYKRLLTVERNFRTVKSDMEIRPVRHRKASRIRGHIYLNFLALWLVKQIELAWKAKGQHDEVAAKLRHWDSRMMIHELVDEQSGQVMEWQWNTGVAAQEVFQEAQRFGEMGSDPPHL